jgi:hypothetical protein
MAEAFSCSLDISKLLFLINIDKTNFQLYFFLMYLVNKTMNPDPDSLEMLDPDAQL